MSDFAAILLKYSVMMMNNDTELSNGFATSESAGGILKLRF
jgi:hypothetical protein